MATPSLSTQAAAAGNYPAFNFGNRERKLLASVKAYVDALSAITATHRVIAGGSFTTLGGDASEAITVSGALATDLAIVLVKTAGGTPRSIVAAAAATNAINVTMSGDPSTDHVLTYLLFRAI
jgi:hypothetical protein